MQLITRPHPHALRRQDLCSCSDKGDQKVAPSKLLPSLRFFASPPAGLGQIGFCGLVILVATVAQQSQVLCNEQSLVPRCHGPNWLSASWAFLPGRLRKLRARRPTQRMLHRGEQEATAYGHRPSGWKILPVAQERLSNANMPYCTSRGDSVTSEPMPRASRLKGTSCL